MQPTRLKPCRCSGNYFFFRVGELILWSRRMRGADLRVERRGWLGQQRPACSLRVSPASPGGRERCPAGGAAVAVVSQPGAQCMAHGARPACQGWLRSCCLATACCWFHFLTPVSACGRVPGTTDHRGTRRTQPGTPAHGLHPNTETHPCGTQPLPSVAGWALAQGGLHPLRDVG